MLPTGMRILVCAVPQDMRRSFDKLAQVTRELLGGGAAEWRALRIHEQERDAGEGVVVGPKRVLHSLQAAAPRAVLRAGRGKGGGGAADRPEALGGCSREWRRKRAR
jgi:hypothetical protein